MLRIYDVSAMIYAGALSSYSKNWHKSYFPTGGLFKLFGYLFRDLKELGLDNWNKPVDKNNKNNIILCFDSKINTRRNIFPWYKSNRSTNKNVVDRLKVNCQIQAAELICQELGIPMIKVDGYEADDFIYSLVRKYKDEHIIIRADDSDLESTLLFANNVYLNSVSGREQINMNQYEMGYKIAYGDVSDNIMPIDQAYRSHVYETFKHKPELFLNPNIGPQTFKGMYPDEVCKQIAVNTFLVTPKFINIGDIKQIDINKTDMIDVLDALSFRKYLKSYFKTERNYGSVGEIEFLSKMMEFLPVEVKEYFVKVEENESRYKTKSEPVKEVKIETNESKVQSNQPSSDLDWVINAYTK